MRIKASTLTIALLAVTSGACAATRWTGTPGHAVVVHEPSRAADAERAAAILRSNGWRVDCGDAGPARRTRSSIAIYAQRSRPGRGTDLADLLRPAIGEADVLPFLTDGPGEHDAVIWIAETR